jgi:hypothetical protein
MKDERIKDFVSMQIKPKTKLTVKNYLEQLQIKKKVSQIKKTL